MDAALSARLAATGVELLPQTPPRHPYDAAVRVGELLYFSGKTAMRDGVVVYAGALVDERDIERGRDAARLCAVQLLSAIEDEIGLEKVVSVPKITVFVSSAPEFTSQPEVANAASSIVREVLGEAGRHARSAVGVPSLPGASTVEIEAIVRVAAEAGE